MQWDWKRLLVAVAVLIVMSALLLLIFPVTNEAERIPENWDFQSKSYKTQTNWIPIIGIIIITILLFIWAFSIPSKDEKSKLLTIYTIIAKSKMAKDKLATKGVFSYNNNEYDLGEYSVGYLLLGEFISERMNRVYGVFIANDNYETTEARNRRESPLISITDHFDDPFIRSTKRNVLPNERGTLENRLRQIHKELKEVDESMFDTVIESAKKAEDEGDEEG